MELSAEDVCQRLQELFDRLTKGWSTQEYHDACEEVAGSFLGRQAAAQSDIDRKEKDR